MYARGHRWPKCAVMEKYSNCEISHSPRGFCRVLRLSFSQPSRRRLAFHLCPRGRSSSCRYSQQFTRSFQQVSFSLSSFLFRVLFFTPVTKAANNTMASSETKNIDDGNPSIQYVGDSWYRRGLGKDFLNTATISKVKGEYATLNFTGSLISVYARVNQSTTAQNFTISSYQVDGGPISNVSRTANETTYRVALFQSSSLPEGNHTLVVTNETDDLPLILDYFMVSSGEPLSTSSAPSPTSQMTSSATSFPASVPDSQNIKKSTDKAAIVGGTIGGVVILLLGLAAFWWRRRRVLGSLGNPNTVQTPMSYTHEPHRPQFKSYTNTTAYTSVSPFLTSPTLESSTSKSTQSGDVQSSSAFIDRHESLYGLSTTTQEPVSPYSSHPTTQSTGRPSFLESDASQSQSGTIISPPPPPYHSRLSLEKKRT
ncbi:hypothetical protein CPB83DRAFT_859292 [Crepidotus variabilis]|uniref:Uncharacterized protein n=1 Tax=Crepidotus variabilis TaxID=179855 RepID=A0A9P6EAW5_9AGAR|nr:hypothetical protein CPB83DRAFT_859292 [Crepidotus variabilis]